MEREHIIDIINKEIDYSDLKKAEYILQKDYEIKKSKMEADDIRLSLKNEHPILIRDKFIIGYDYLKKAFEDSTGDFFDIERPVEAIEIIDKISGDREYFAIVNKNEWDRDLSGFNSTIGQLKLGEIYLPKHSAIFNFLNPTEKTKSEKIQSVLNGVNINIYEYDNYVDNCFHEIGHLFWRVCTRYEEKIQFKELFKHLKQSAIYEYEWERSDEEEVFCTVYKWYLKSILINQSFYNILEYEEPYGLKILQDIFDRIAKERLIDDIWKMSKEDVIEYLNPKFDRTTGKYIRKSGLFDKVKDIELPEAVINNILSVHDGMSFIELGKAVIPIKDRMIDWNNLKIHSLNKAETNPTIYLDMDGLVTNFAEAYKQAFDRDVFQDDSFTVTQFCLTEPRFFRTIPVLEKGKELYNRLIKKYQVIFLTTPMEGMEYCKADKLAWIKEHITDNPTIIFSDNKSDYAHSMHDILIDDMKYNLEPFSEAGGTAIDFTKHTNDEIMQKIYNVLNPNEEIKQIKKQIKEMNVNVNPTPRQKETGNYKKGMIVFKQLPVMIENPKGSVRWGFGENGKKWISKMQNHYGYIKGTEGNDGDCIDCFIGDRPSSNKAFVVNQGFNNMFDEHKVMLGFDSIEEAKDAYLANYEKGWEKNIMSIIPTNTKKLREWLQNGVKTEPYSESK